MLTQDTLQTAVSAALKNWADLNGTTTNLLENLLLVQQEREKTASLSPAARRLAANQILLDGIDGLSRQDPTGAKVLRLRFMDGDTVLMAARKLNLSEDQLKRRQRTAIRRLTDLIWERETAVRTDRIHTIQAQLMPAGYDKLFGVQAVEAELMAHLQTAVSPHVIALVGIGGIGKTSLADTAARQLAAEFRYEEIVWLRVNAEESDHATHTPQTTLEQILDGIAERICPQATAAERDVSLRRTLKSSPHLIIIDNLESDADVAFMLDALSDLANPSKFLLTTRVRLPASASTLSLFLAELSLADAGDLIRHQAKLIGLSDLANVPDEAIAHIYEATGGNPLAIKLVVGLTTVLPLPQILQELTTAHTAQVEAMYRHIYWQTWRILSENAKILLEMMPMSAGVGVQPAQMEAMSELTAVQLWPAIAELVNHSLLEPRGTVWERRYGIHRLTESFLRTEIIQWPES